MREAARPKRLYRLLSRVIDGVVVVVLLGGGGGVGIIICCVLLGVG